MLLNWMPSVSDRGSRQSGSNLVAILGLMAILLDYLSEALPWITTVKVFPIPLVTWTLQGGQLTSFWVPHFDYVVLSLLLVLGWPLAVDIIKVTARYSWLTTKHFSAGRPWTHRGGRYLLCPSLISSFKTTWLALTEWFALSLCWSNPDEWWWLLWTRTVSGLFHRAWQMCECERREVTACSFHAVRPDTCTSEHSWQVLIGALTCSLLVEEMLDSCLLLPSVLILGLPKPPAAEEALV